MDIQKERNDFERHWVNYSQCSYQDFYFNAGEYSCENMNDAWRAWIARAKIVPEGFVLLPVEPILEMLKAASKLAPIKAMIKPQEQSHA